MHCASLLVVYCSLGLCADESAASSPPPMTELQGIWRTEKVAGPEGDLSADSKMVLAIRSARWTLRAGDKNLEAQLTLDPKQDPPAIDLKSEESSARGIYRREGDKLTICLRDSGEGRPSKFESSGSDLLMILRRAEAKHSLVICDLDGGNPHKLRPVPGYDAYGTPTWSRDGKRVGCDAWTGALGETYQAAHALTMNADGSDPRDLGDGAMPSFSANGREVAFCRYSPNYGVWACKTDGSGLTCIEEGAWGIRFSPQNPNVVAFTVNEDGGNLRLLDRKTNSSRLLLEKQKYQLIYWSWNWSPDGQWLCFVGMSTKGKRDLAAVHVDGEAKGFQRLLEKNTSFSGVGNGVSWASDSRRLLVRGTPKGSKFQQLFTLDFDPAAVPVRVPKLDPDHSYTDAAWSPDGKHLLHCTR